jgi:hypothetical protein
MQIVDPNVVVIVITGLDPELEQQPGVCGLLAKPFAADELKTMADAAIWT